MYNIVIALTLALALFIFLLDKFEKEDNMVVCCLSIFFVYILLDQIDRLL